MTSHNGQHQAQYDGPMAEPQIITGTVNIQLSDSEIVDLAEALGIDIDAMIAADGGTNDEERP